MERPGTAYSESDLRGDYSGAAADYTVEQDWDAYSPAMHERWSRLYTRQAALAHRYAARTFLDGVRKVAPRDVESLGASVRVLREIELFHRKLISMHLEREPRSVRVLNELRRS